MAMKMFSHENQSKSEDFNEMYKSKTIKISCKQKKRKSSSKCWRDCKNFEIILVNKKFVHDICVASAGQAKSCSRFALVAQKTTAKYEHECRAEG